MNRLLLLIATGSATVLTFDALASSASRRAGFPYGWASVGSLVIYFVLGAFAARLGGVRAAVAVGLVVGLIDATIGELISSSIGPVRPPLESDAPSYRLLIALEVTALTVLFSCLGALARERWFRPR